MSDCSTNAMKSKKRHKAMCCRCGEFLCEKPVLYPLGRNRLIYVDRCMIPELQSLWNRGIETGGCCCGHFKKDGFIQVLPKYVGAMRELGYEEIPPVEINGCLMGEHAFKPKTVFEFNGYNETKTELEQCYRQLEQVAKNMWHFQNIVFDDLGIEPSFTRDATGETWSVPKFGEQLLELGVNLDD